jgi:hypothetical protein
MDEVCKSACYLTESAYLVPNAVDNAMSPTEAGFKLAFRCQDIGFYPWLEGAGCESMDSACLLQAKPGYISPDASNPNKFRLERFGIGMSGQTKHFGSIVNGRP